MKTLDAESFHIAIENLRAALGIVKSATDSIRIDVGRLQKGIEIGISQAAVAKRTIEAANAVDGYGASLDLSIEVLARAQRVLELAKAKKLPNAATS